MAIGSIATCLSHESGEVSASGEEREEGVRPLEHGLHGRHVVLGPPLHQRLLRPLAQRRAPLGSTARWGVWDTCTHMMPGSAFSTHADAWGLTDSP